MQLNKRLHPTAWNPAPQREDLYQMAAYVGRWGAEGLLIYPEDQGTPGEPPAASGSPWFLGGGQAISFVSLPARLDEARARLADLRGAGAEGR